MGKKFIEFKGPDDPTIGALANGLWECLMKEGQEFDMPYAGAYFKADGKRYKMTIAQVKEDATD